MLSSCALPALANQADLFFDFSSKIRAGSSAAATDQSSDADTAENSPAVAPEVDQALAELEALFAEQMEDLLLELEASLESYHDGTSEDPSFAAVSALNITTESLLSLSVTQVPANASAEEWISAYGHLISSEQQGYYSAEATGYTT